MRPRLRTIAVAVGALAALVVALAAASPGAAQPPGDRSGRRDRAARLRAIGRALAAAGDPGSAAGYYRDAIRVDPSDAEAYEALGTIYLERGSIGDALEVYAVGLRHRPDHAPLLRGQARALAARGDLDGAATALRALIDAAPEDVLAHLDRAALARRRGAFSEALASYRAILDLAARGRPVAEEGLSEARRYAAALVLLVEANDPVAGAIDCAAEPSPVRRALAACR